MSDDDFTNRLVGLQAGDNTAWTETVNELAGPLRGYLQLRGCDDAENTLGDVFLEISRSIDRFEGDRHSFRAWVYTIARRRMIDKRRYRARRPKKAVDPTVLAETLRVGGDVEEEALASLGTDWAINQLESLTPLQRDVISLRFVAGLGIEEVAETLATTASAVKATQRRALRRLQRRLTTKQAGNETDRARHPNYSRPAADHK